MKKILRIILIVFVSISLIACKNQDDILKEASLRLVVVNDNMNTSFGSAVIYDSDEYYYYALTNEHVIDDSIKIEALDYQNNVYEVVVLKEDETIDLAVITIPKQNDLYELEFADQYIVGDEVISVGFPNSIYKVTYGQIIDYGSINYDIATDMIIHSAEIDHGSSGGVLLNEKNKIIGLNFGALIEENILIESYAIPLETIVEFIK